MKIEEILTFAKQNSMVSIYGAGLIGRSLAEILIDLKVSIHSFVVSDNQDFTQSQISLIPIVKLSAWIALMKNSDSGLLVAVSKSYQPKLP